jgi:serine O-acetyltransferase
MSTIQAVKLDLKRLKAEYGISIFMAILSNKGFHALLFYRMSNWVYKKNLPLIPLVLTRIVQIMYAIDIDYKAQIEGGLVILHGVGLVIGQGVVLKSNCTIYHGVTLGRRRQGINIPTDDGYPFINHNCLIGAGAVIIGPIQVGPNSIIGPNCVITESIPADAIVKMTSPYYSLRSKPTDSLQPDLSRSEV